MAKHRGFLTYDQLREARRNALDEASKTRIPQLLLLNPYEKLSPFNLWFENQNYRVEDYVYNKTSSLRLRYYRDLILSIKPNRSHDNLDHVKESIPHMTVYQAFYPESFYVVWEFLNKGLMKPRNVLVVSQERRLGAMEAILLSQVRAAVNVNKYDHHVWNIGDEKILQDGSLEIRHGFPYLTINNPTVYLTNSRQTTSYDSIIVDNISLFSPNLRWNCYQEDFSGTLYYVLESLRSLERHGSLMVKITLLRQSLWRFLFNLIGPYFQEYEIYRSVTTHPLDPEAYLFLGDYQKPEEYPSQFYWVMTLCASRYYLAGVRLEDDADLTGIGERYDQVVMEYLQRIREARPVTSYQAIDEYLESQELQAVKDLCQQISNDPAKATILRSPLVKLLPYPPEELYQDRFYQKIVDAQGDLNFLKEVMNGIKGKSERGYPDDFLTYSETKNTLDISHRIKNQLHREYGTEMTTVAWLKLYEILNAYPELLPVSSGQVVRTFNICDAPGAFVAAINQYVTNRGGVLDWYAQSLNFENPETGTVGFDDAYGLVASHPDRWLFGKDSTGDVTHAVNIRGYREDPRVKGVDLMTGDAGLEAGYNYQEITLIKVNMGQILVILSCLRKGGSGVVKTFLPLSCPLSVSIINLLSSLFRKVDLFKPTTSHSVNSEVYLILIDFRGISTDDLDVLYGLLEDPKITCESLLSDRIRPDFVSSYAKAVVRMIDRQMSFLEVSYHYYFTGSRLRQNANDWFVHNPVKPLEHPLLSEKGAVKTHNIDVDSAFD